MAGGAAGRTERLMCLVFLLKARGPRGVTRAELRESIEDYSRIANEVAFERALERDKAALREAGVVIDVVQRDAWNEDEFAYVLGHNTLLALRTDFDADELQMLGLAAEAWERGTWSAMAHGALRKLEVFGDAYAAQPRPRISMREDAHLEPLRAAIRDRRSVRFTYRRPGDTSPALRQVEPWGLLYRLGGWYCVGFDLARSAPRVFRTSRIASEVTSDAPSTHEVDAQWPALVRSGGPESGAFQAQLLIAPGRGWTWRSRGSLVRTHELDGAAFDVVELELTDHDRLVAQLAAAAPDVLVLQPQDLRQRVTAWLQEVRHG